MNRQLAAAAELHQFLTTEGILYAVIGGLAVQYWGEPRFTQDVDLTVAAPSGGAANLAERIVARFEPRISDAVTFARRSRMVLIFAKNGCPVDIALGVPGYEDEMMRRTSEYQVEAGTVIRICSAEDLIVHKAIAGRPQDVRDIEGIIYRQGNKLDAAYVRRWLAEFADVMGDPEIVARFERPWRDLEIGA